MASSANEQEEKEGMEVGQRDGMCLCVCVCVCVGGGERKA